MSSAVSRSSYIAALWFLSICTQASAVHAQTCGQLLRSANLNYSGPQFINVETFLSWDRGAWDRCSLLQQYNWEGYLCGGKRYDLGRSWSGYVDGQPSQAPQSVSVPIKVIDQDQRRWDLNLRKTNRFHDSSVSSRNFRCQRSEKDQSLFIETEQRSYAGMVQNLNIPIEIRHIIFSAYRVFIPKF
jgi:hypothetical protein